MELQPDTILNNRYRIIRPLGQGGMGAVHLANDLSLEHEVAIKSNRGTSEHSINQFIREARLLATLRHPNLPRVIDYFIVENTQFLVMDYIPGEDLEKLRKERGALPLEQVLHWVTELGSAIVYLHNQNPPIIHRDIKPANIKITPDGHAILVDFGIAKAVTASQTTLGATGYTPGYAPPEQYGGARTGPFSDQYSLAATLYALLSGQKPPESLSLAMNEAVLTPLQQLNPSVPPQIHEIIAHAMSVRPTERFSSMDEFIRTLLSWRTLKEGQITAAAVNDATIATPAKGQKAAGAKPQSRSWILPCGIIAALVLLGGLAAAAAGYIFLWRTPTTVALEATLPVSTQPVDTQQPEPQNDTPTPTPTASPTEFYSPTATFTTAPEATSTPAPVLLGNGGTVVFVSDRADSQTFQIWTMKVYQTYDNQIITDDLTQITFDAGDKHQPEWSPNGLRIAYSAPDPDGSGTQIFIINTSGGSTEPVQVTNLDGENMYPAWSPDSNTIAFTNYGRYNPVYQMYLINVNGSGLTRLSLDFQEKMAAWSPDGNTLLFVVMAESHDYLWIRTSVDEFVEPEQFDRTTFFGRLGEVADPSWSPNATYIAYTHVRNDRSEVNIVEYTSHGADIVELTPDDQTARDPAWSPDSQWVIFTSERGNNAEIYIMTTNGLLQTNLTQNPARDQEADWR